MKFFDRLVQETLKNRRELVTQLIRREVAELLNLHPGAEKTLDAGKAFREIGIGSLMGVMLRGRLQEKLEGTVDLPPTVVIDYPNIELLGEFILKESGLGEAKQETKAQGSRDAELDSLIDELLQDSSDKAA